MILMWRETVSHRMVRRDVRQVVNLMGWLMVGWLMLRLFKYQLLSDGLLCRMCWYGYYIFQLALPETNCQGLFNQIHKKATKKCQKQILAPDTFADGLFAPA